MGPNCIGIIRPAIGLNATYAQGSALPGSIGLISQSGALVASMLDWAKPNNVGFSSVISVGNAADIDIGEVLDYLVQDRKTESIFLYVEGIHNARRFMSALRAAARVKPVLLIKVGRHPGAAQAIKSHTGMLVGDDDVFDAALRRAGVVRLQIHGPDVRRGERAVLALPPERQSARGDHQWRRPRRDGGGSRRRTYHSAGGAVRGHDRTAERDAFGQLVTRQSDRRRSATPRRPNTTQRFRPAWPTKTSTECWPFSPRRR